MCDVYNIEHNIQQIYNNKYRVDDIAQIYSKLYMVCLSFSIDMRQMNYCEKGKMFYSRYIFYKIYKNDIRIRPCI